MEERGSTADDDHHNNSLHENRAFNSTSESENRRLADEFLPENLNHPAFGAGTYVVQVPKDQIYRVPPPEHAALAKRGGNLDKPKGPYCCCGCSNCKCIFVVIVIIVLIIALGGLSSIFLKKRNPTFSIEHVIFKNISNHYEITLKTKNPNQYARIFYVQGSDASLSFKQKEIATGKYPTFDQAPKNSTVLDMVLRGSKGLPREIQKALNGTNSKSVGIDLSLSMNVPVNMKVWEFNTGSKKIVVSCSMKLNTLSRKTSVLSQECHTGS